MKIGIPRAFLYHKYAVLWKTFFDEVGIPYIVSPETNREILKRGSALAIDESCLSSKVHLGHVAWLLGKCDVVLIPRVASCGNHGTVCTRFMALCDIVRNIFREQDIKILYYNIDDPRSTSELKAFLEMGKYLGLKKSLVKQSYLIAKQAQTTYLTVRAQNVEQKLNTNKIKILVVGHAYNVYDKYVGEPVLNGLRELGCEPVLAEEAPATEAIEASYQLSTTMPWAFNRHLAGAIQLYRNRVDGIVLMTAFPCGPDALVNECLIRQIKDKPILNLTLDNQDGSAGLETRLESFVDIIRFKQEEGVL